jgi:hypothetical protein
VLFVYLKVTRYKIEEIYNLQIILENHIINNYLPNLITRINIKHLVLGLTTILLSHFTYGQTSLNVTGTYEYEGKTTIKDGDTYGYFGTIQVKKFKHNKIIMTFYICKGAPSYNSGSFVDTLDVVNNIVTYTAEDCVTTFTFSKKGIDVKEKSNDYCWGYGVYAHGKFRKKSNKQPVLNDPLTGKKL